MTDKQAMQKIILLLMRYKGIISAIIIFLFLSAGINICIPFISSRIMDDGFIAGDKEVLIKLTLLSFVLYVLDNIFVMLKEKQRVMVAAKLKYFLEESAFEHLLKLRIKYFEDKNHTEILSNLSMDINNISSIMDGNFFFVITQVFSMVGGITGLFILDSRLTILVLIFVPVKYVIMKFFSRQRKQIMDAFIMSSQRYSRWFGDAVGGIKEIKLFGIHENKRNEFKTAKQIVIEKEKELNMLNQYNSVIDSILVQSLLTLIYILGANLVFGFQLSIGCIFTFVTYSIYVTAPISALLNLGYCLSGILPSTKRYYSFMAYEEEDDNDNDANIGLFNKMDLTNISFSYDGEKEVLNNINISICEKEKIAIIGLNGSGKSTLLDLFLRMYEPTKGRIFLGGVDIRKIPMKKYRDMFSVVSQNVYLFDDTIANNISLYQKISNDTIMKACIKSGLQDFIKEVSLEYNVGQGGMKLSGGQRQKIALARALVHNRPILIFDEATSNVDNFSMQQINMLLRTELKDKTVIIATHQVEILQEVDKIIELENGIIISEKVGYK